MNPPRKLTFNELREGMRVFLEFPRVESSFQEEAERTVDKILLAKARNGGRDQIDVLSEYLDAGSDTVERLKIITGFSNGSLEKLKRIYAAVFPRESWSAIRRDANMRRRIAAFLTDPQREAAFVPQFIRRNFALPDNWIDSLQDRAYMQAVVQGGMQSKYSVAIGDALEEAVRDLAAETGCAQEKGPVQIVDDKEVDIAIPDASNPRILIMSSYQLMTSSSQSSKANEQARMYEDVRRHNASRSRRGMANVQLVNVIDGGGWLERPKYLQTMWSECDHCFPHSRLDELKAVLDCFHPRDERG